MIFLYGKLIVIQLISAALAGAVFVFIPSKQIAGVIAGIGFLAWNSISLLSLKPHLRRSVLFFANLVFLLGVTIPMLGSRLLNWGVPFEDITIWGISGPSFHLLSTTLFRLVFAVNLLEGCFYIWKSKKHERKNH
jgi:hypothetical protein